MIRVIHLAPHYPIPSPGPHGLVLRRLGEDDPTAIVTEIIFYGPDGGATPARSTDASARTIKEAIHQVIDLIANHHARMIYVLDRTRGSGNKKSSAPTAPTTSPLISLPTPTSRTTNWAPTCVTAPTMPASCDK